MGNGVYDLHCHVMGHAINPDSVGLGAQPGNLAFCQLARGGNGFFTGLWQIIVAIQV